MIDAEPLQITAFAIAEFDSNTQFQPSTYLLKIKTCQRTLFLYEISAEHKMVFTTLSRRHFEGLEAYEYLLRFACGLESEIKGETDVFGQVKTAYKNLAKQNPASAESLKGIFLKLFEDTKEIRSQHLHGIGGNTYGALARRLIGPTPQDRVLVIGAGEISKSVAPYFAECSLKIWNRSAGRLEVLGAELTKKGHSASLLTSEKELSLAIAEASLILIATPFGSGIETLVEKHRCENSKILHLGAQASEVVRLSFPSLSLSDLFALENEQGQLRQKQVHQAIHACHERALLRSLSRSIHVAHGWEDLAVFL